MIRTANRVALYARFSSDNQRTESIDAQVRAMEAYCQQHSYRIVNTYIDEAKSATSDQRPAFQRMISDSSSHIFDILLVHKLDRFARNRYDSAIYKRELKKNGVAVHSVLENLDSSPESIILESVLEGMSEYYSQNLAREVMKGMRETALQGKHTGGKPPLGYDIDPSTKKLVINPDEADTVRLIFNMYSQGIGYSPILEALHEQGRKTKNGNVFQKNSLYSILTNRKYQGTYVFNRSSSKNGLGTRNTHLEKASEDMIVIDGGCPQIVDSDTFHKVQTRIQNNQHTGGRVNAKTCYLLSGKIYCKECGRAMVGNTHRSGRNKLIHSTYRCPSKRHSCSNKEINREYLECYVTKLLEEHIFNAPALHSITKKISKHTATLSRHVAENAESIQKKLADLDLAIHNVADAIASGLLSDALISRLTELEKEKTALEASLHVATPATEVIIDPRTILAEYHSIRQAPTAPAYKGFITGFIDRIVVGQYSVTITIKTGLDVCPTLDTTVTARRQELYTQYKRPG